MDRQFKKHWVTLVDYARRLSMAKDGRVGVNVYHHQKAGKAFNAVQVHLNALHRQALKKVLIDGNANEILSVMRAISSDRGFV